MSEEVHFMTTGTFIDGVPGSFPLGSRVVLNAETRQVLRVETMDGNPLDVPIEGEEDNVQEETHPGIPQSFGG